jgi:hypothetical protein
MTHATSQTFNSPREPGTISRRAMTRGHKFRRRRVPYPCYGLHLDVVRGLGVLAYGTVRRSDRCLTVSECVQCAALRRRTKRDQWMSSRWRTHHATHHVRCVHDKVASIELGMCVLRLACSGIS